MRWTAAEYEQYLARSREAYAKALRANSAGGAPCGAVAESLVCDEPVATSKRKEGNATRVHVRVVSFRRKLCDPDNLCPKYFIDCLRSAGLIRDDSPEFITLEVAQEKVKGKANERTEIELT